MKSFEITDADAGTRLDRFLAGQCAHLSRSRIQALIKSGHVLRNDATAKSGDVLRAGDRVSLTEPETRPTLTEGEDIPLDILYEDADLIVLNKPPGIVVHPAAGHWSGTLVNALLHHCGGLSSIGGEQRPGIVHRLDKDTSGCLVVAKNDFTHERLSRQFAGRSVAKQYLALVHGPLKKRSGSIEAPIGRHAIHRKKMTVTEKGKSARTDYRVVQDLGDLALLECRLHTGRTHQIRVHLKHLGHPLAGDPVYGGKAPGRFPRQMLHAWQLGFHHPRNEKWMEFTAPLPLDFLQIGARIG